MIGKVHRIMNDRAVMREAEIFIMSPAGTIKPFMVRVGETIQICEPKKKEKKKRGRPPKKDRSRL